MAGKELGTKYACFKCGTKFYDFKERQKMAEILLPVRQRVAKEVGISDIFDLIERGAK